MTEPLAPGVNMLKKCSRCLIDLPLDKFCPRKGTTDGFNGKCKECRYQESKAWKTNNPVNYLCSNMLTKARKRAQSKGWAFDLTFEDLQHLVVSHCPILGTELVWKYGHGLGLGAHSPSLDRIDNSLGYTKDNVAIISHKANSMKNSCTIEELQAILDYIQNPPKAKAGSQPPLLDMVEDSAIIQELSDYEQSMADQPLWSLAMHAGESTPGTRRDAFAAELRVIIDWLIPEDDRMILSPTNQPGEYFRWLERKRLREMLLAEADRAEQVDEYYLRHSDAI